MIGQFLVTIKSFSLEGQILELFQCIKSGPFQSPAA